MKQEGTGDLLVFIFLLRFHSGLKNKIYLSGILKGINIDMKMIERTTPLLVLAVGIDSALPRITNMRR